MSVEWQTRKLCDIADIRVSNVDKKVYATETPVKLCNYMDVYANDYVTGTIDFMPGSASKAEVERFGVLRGDVIITKDSETPDDIGVPAVVIDEIRDLVCGYHLCLIRPKNGEVDSVYLAKQLGTSRVVNYFAVNASGSTRFGLPVGAIENLEVPFAPEREQSKIAEILSTVDRAIEQTEALIAKQQRIKTGLMQDLLTRGIDEQGNLRSEETHQFKDSPLGRIPVEWDVARIGDACVVQGGFAFSSNDYAEDGVGLLRISNISRDALNMNDAAHLPTRYVKMFEKFAAKEGDIVIALSGATTGKCCRVPRDVLPCLVNQRVGRFQVTRPDELEVDFLFAIINSPRIQTEVVIDSMGGAQPNVSPMEIEALEYTRPPIHEQRHIGEVLASFEAEVVEKHKRLRKLRSLKTALMQDLLTGEKRVTPLLEPAVTT